MNSPRSIWLVLRCAFAVAGITTGALTGRLPGDVIDTSSTVPGSAQAAASEEYPQVTCSGTNPALVSEVLQMAADTRDSLKPVLKLGAAWRYPVHLTLLDAAGPADSEAKNEKVTAVMDGANLCLEGKVASNDADAREFVRRQFVTALLWEKFFKPDQVFTAETRLDVVPLWLIEGLRESLSEDPTHNREAIVKRAGLAQRAPTLDEVTGWKALSGDRLLNLWQRAFCYYLVQCLTHPNSRLIDFQGWLASITGPNPKTASYLFPTEMGWQRELVEAPNRGRALVFTWEESAAEISAAQTIELPKGKHAADTRLCTLDNVATFPISQDMRAAINAKLLELTALELRIHSSWHPVIEQYRFGLSALLADPNNKRALAHLHEARVRRAAEMNFRETLVDYVNWFEVTQYMPAEASHFREYFSTAAELDKAEPDPSHPNPLRENLLQVESRF